MEDTVNQAVDGLPADETLDSALEPKEEPKTADSVPDIEQRIEAIREEAALREKRILEELDRTRRSVRDSNDSVVKRIQEKLAPKRETYDKLVAKGKLEREEADNLLVNERMQIEEQIAKEAPKPEPSLTEEEQDAMDEELRAIRVAAGISEGDEEYRKLPKTWVDESGNPTGSYIKALAGYRKKAGELVRDKQQRISATKQARLDKAASQVPPSDAPGGKTAGVDTVESLTEQLQALNRKRALTPSGRIQNKKQADEIEAKLAKLM